MNLDLHLNQSFILWMSGKRISTIFFIPFLLLLFTHIKGIIFRMCLHDYMIYMEYSCDLGQQDDLASTNDQEAN